MTDYQAAWQAMTRDARYLANLDWGRPRPGHPEGTLRAHIAQLERNLAALQPRLSPDEVWKLKLLIHAHDTFKPDALAGAPIAHPQSHASLARAFLAEFCSDSDLLAMVQWHDEPYALWMQQRHKGAFSQRRLESLLSAIGDWELFAAFLLIDNVTEGKDPQPLEWFFELVKGRVKTRFSPADLR
jgi:hypothetical protein